MKAFFPLKQNSFDSLSAILRNIVLVGFFSLPLIPLFFSSSLLFPFVSSKGFVFRVVTELLFGLWLMLIFLRKEYRIRGSFILWTILVFIGVTTLSDVSGVNFQRSFWSDYERMEGLVTWLHLLAFFLIAISVVKTEKLWRNFFLISLWASAVVSGYSLLQKIGIAPLLQSGTRLEGTLGNASFLAAYLLIHIFLAVLLFFQGLDTHTRRWFYGSVVSLHLIVVYLSGTRGAIIGLFISISLLLLLIFISEKNEKYLRKAAVLGFVVLLLAGTAFFTLSHKFVARGDSTWVRLASLAPNRIMNEPRIYLWQTAWAGIKERPILGWGRENFVYVAEKYYDPRLSLEDAWFDRAHNAVLDQLVAGGIAGLLAYLSIFLAIIYYLIFTKPEVFSRKEKYALLGLLTAYFTQNLFTLDSIASYSLFFSLTGYIHVRSTSAKEHSQALTNKAQHAKAWRNGFIRALAIITLAVVTMLAAYFVNWKAYRANKVVAVALASDEETLSLFKEGLEYKSFGNLEIREQLAMKALALSEVNPNTYQERAALFALAVSEMESQTAIEPSLARHYFVLGELARISGNVEDALNYWEKAVALAPARKDVRYNLASLYQEQEEYGQALVHFKRLYELESKFPQTSQYQYYIDTAFQRYAVALILAGKEDVAEVLMEEKYGTALRAEDEIINAYVARGAYEKVLALWQTRLQDDLENPDYYLALGATYYKLGLRQKAIDSIRAAVNLEPSYQEPAEFLIQEILAGREIANE